MAKTAIVFPGQGTQHTGMGKSLYEEFTGFRDVFDRASSILEVDLRRLCFEGAQDELNLTVNTQIAVLAFNVALYNVFKEKTDIVSSVMAGHSLGEYCAIYAAGAVGFDDLFLLVQARARYHQEAVPPGVGAMGAIIGMDDASVLSICADTSNDKEQVSLVIANAPEQVVVSGHASAVNKVMLSAREKGAMKAVLLPISAPCHCSLLESAALRLAENLACVTFQNFSVPVIPNCDPSIFYTPENARNLLQRQIVSPVKWRQTVERMAEMGIERVIEIGPKKTLCGLIKRINNKMSLFCVESAPSLSKTIETIMN